MQWRCFYWATLLPNRPISVNKNLVYFWFVKFFLDVWPQYFTKHDILITRMQKYKDVISFWTGSCKHININKLLIILVLVGVMLICDWQIIWTNEFKIPQNELMQINKKEQLELPQCWLTERVYAQKEKSIYACHYVSINTKSGYYDFR